MTYRTHRQEVPMIHVMPRKPRSWGVRVMSVFALILLGANAFAVFSIGDTISYYSDKERSVANTLFSGALDFIVETHATSSDFRRINCVPYASVHQEVEIEPDPDSNPFKYTVYVEEAFGDYKFCDDLHAKVMLNGYEVYEGSLLDIFVPATTTTGTWEFWIETRKFKNNLQCSFDLAFRGWQTRHDHPTYENGGFKDIERSSIRLATWGVRINKAYPTVDPERGVDPNNEWVELYNQTNKRVRLDGWQICADGVCDELPRRTEIPPYGFLMIAGERETFRIWNAPRGVRKLVLGDGLIGDGLAEKGTLELKRKDGTLIDDVTWGEDAAPAPQNGEVLARKVTGFDTNSPEDWELLVPPTIDLLHPDEGGTYMWKWGHMMNLMWEAHNQNGPDEDLMMSFYLILDKNDDGEIGQGDAVFPIVKKTENDGMYQWKVFRGFKGHAWIKAVATGPENPLLTSATTSGRIYLDRDRDRKGFEKILDIVATAIGWSFMNFEPELETHHFIPDLFPDLDAPAAPPVELPSIDTILFSELAHFEDLPNLEEIASATTSASTDPIEEVINTDQGTSTVSIVVVTEAGTTTGATSTEEIASTTPSSTAESLRDHILGKLKTSSEIEETSTSTESLTEDTATSTEEITEGESVENGDSLEEEGETNIE